MSSSCSDHECPRGFNCWSNCYLKLTLYLAQKLENRAGLRLDTASQKNWNWFPTRTITACWVSHADTASHLEQGWIGYWSVVRYCVWSHWAIIENPFKCLNGCIDWVLPERQKQNVFISSCMMLDILPIWPWFVQEEYVEANSLCELLNTESRNFFSCYFWNRVQKVFHSLLLAVCAVRLQCWYGSSTFSCFPAVQAHTTGAIWMQNSGS